MRPSKLRVDDPCASRYCAVTAIPGLGPSPDAIGLTMTLNSETDRLITRYVTRLNDNSATNFASIGVNFEDIGHGIWQSRLSTSVRESFRALFGLLSLFGFFAVV